MRATWPGLRIGNRSLNSIRLWMLTSSIVVATSALSGQAATAKQSSTDSKVFGAVQRPSVDDSADIASSQRYGMRQSIQSFFEAFLASLCVCLFDFIYFGPVGIREVGRVDQLRFIVLLQHECL
jgi:hypothetical protein